MRSLSLSVSLHTAVSHIHNSTTVCRVCQHLHAQPMPLMLVVFLSANTTTRILLFFTVNFRCSHSKNPSMPCLALSMCAIACVLIPSPPPPPSSMMIARNKGGSRNSHTGECFFQFVHSLRTTTKRSHTHTRATNR